jgi:hypothetical protein
MMHRSDNKKNEIEDVSQGEKCQHTECYPTTLLKIYIYIRRVKRKDIQTNKHH